MREKLDGMDEIARQDQVLLEWNCLHYYVPVTAKQTIVAPDMARELS